MKHTLKTLCSLYIILLLFTSCNKKENNRLEYALNFAGENRIELEKVLEHYKDSALKYQAACFLIENMPHCYTEIGWQLDTIRLLLSHIEDNEEVDIQARKRWRGVNPKCERVYDAHVITSKYLINNIERAFESWQSRVWNKYLPFDEFCELILPYRVDHEPLEEWWDFYKKKYSFLIDSLYKGSDVIAAADLVRDSMNAEGFRYCSDFNITSLGASHLFKNRIGKCGDSCDFLLYTMRSLGIPVATDCYLYASETRTGHSWHVVRDTTGNYLSFSFTEKSHPIRGKVYTDWRKIGKAYRKCFGLQKEPVSGWYRDKSIPSSLKHPYLKDVSSDYFKDSLILELNDVPDGAIYLGVFKRDTWHILDRSILEKGKACFKNIEAGLVYMPLHFDGEKVHEVSYPFYFDGKNNHPYIPKEETTESVELLRKNPYYYWLKGIAGGTTIGGRFEVSDVPDFKTKKLLYEVCDTPKIEYNLILLDVPVKARYARYIVPKHMDTDLAEMNFIYKKNTLHPVKLMGDLGENSEFSINKLLDGDPLSTYKAKEKGGAAIYDFGSSVWIDSFAYMPRNADNCVRIGDTYELLYHGGSKGWISLGVKTAKEPRLFYDVPQGALFYLRNLSRGVEELPFSIEDGQQKFLTVLEDHDLGCYK